MTVWGSLMAPGSRAQMLELNRRSAAIRTAKSRLKSECKAGRFCVAELLETQHVDPLIAKVEIYDLLRWEKSTGIHNARQLLAGLPISPQIAVGRLSLHTRALIAARVRVRRDRLEAAWQAQRDRMTRSLVA